jgi:acid phosphatase
MKTRIAHAWLVLAPLVASIPLACSSSNEDLKASNGSQGDIGLALQIGGGATLNTVTYQITGPNGFARSGNIDVSTSTTISATIGGIPAGTGYTIALTGTSTDGGTMCSGSAGFDVTAGKTTQVPVAVACHEPHRTGSVSVNGTVNVCPTIDGVSATPAEAFVGGTIALSGSAHDGDSGPSALTYAWSTSSGKLSDPTSATPTLTCTAAGTATVTLTVSDGDSTPGCADVVTTPVTCSPDPLVADVQNIVFVYMENRSFDGLFGNYPGAHGLSEVVDGSGTPTAAYVPQKDRDGATVLSKLPQTWNGVTASGNPTVITQAQSDNLANAPFEAETAFVANGAPPLTTLDVTRDLAHRFFENQMEINGGTNDQYAAWLDAGGLTMGHFDYSKSALWAIARQAVVADNFFEAAFGGSFLNHQYLICACAPTVSASFVTNNKASLNTLAAPNAKGVPQLAQNSSSPASALSGPPSFQTGNITPLDYFGTGDGYRAVNTMQPAYQPSGNFPASGATDLRYADPGAATTLPPQTQTTIGDLLSAAGVGWAWYATSWDAATTDGQKAAGSSHTVIYTPSSPRGNPDFQAHHHPFNYYAAFDPATHAADRSAHLRDYNALVSDIQGGTLPPVAYYKPTGYVNQHPGYANIDDADAHVTDLVNKLKAGPQWAHMVIVITYDEYGGQWDHVAPPKGDLIGPGTRIPAIIISPYAKAGKVDHTQYDTASITRLIARRFSLPALPGVTARDQALVANGAPKMGDLSNALTLP